MSPFFLFGEQRAARERLIGAPCVRATRRSFATSLCLVLGMGRRGGRACVTWIVSHRSRRQGLRALERACGLRPTACLDCSAAA